MKQVLQFKITLLDTKPPIWRRIQIADTCTFWDLHVAIQDAMGWEDCHLHQFIVCSGQRRTPDKRIFIGFPEESFELDCTLISWETKINEYLTPEYQIMYEYDFGDSWEHEIKFEGNFDKITGQKYPLCLEGKLACPPEDIGGIGGYYSFVEAMADKSHPEHNDYVDWYGDKFNPEVFNVKKVKFRNPKIWLKKTLENMG